MRRVIDENGKFIRTKLMFSGDLHLYDKEIGATIGYGEESTRNVVNLRKHYVDSDCVLHVLGGDIQHGKPDDIRLMSTWRAALIELRDLVRERIIESGLDKIMKVYDADGNEMDYMNEVSCLFSVKGNHDYLKRVARKDSFTFFDDLVDVDIISVPKKIIIGDTQINLYSSEECSSPIGIDEGINAVIGVYHDPIVQDGRLMDKYMGKMISPDKHKFFDRVDIAVLNDIHLPIEPYVVTTVGADGVGTMTTVITHGSIGRTSFSDSHKRDHAFITEIEIEPGGVLSYELSEMELFPYKQLFDYETVVKVKKQENLFEHFSLEIEKVDRVKGDPREEILALSVDDEVKRSCLELLCEVLNDENFDIDGFMGGKPVGAVISEDVVDGDKADGVVDVSNRNASADDGSIDLGFDFDSEELDESLGLF